MGKLLTKEELEEIGGSRGVSAVRRRLLSHIAAQEERIGELEELTEEAESIIVERAEGAASEVERLEAQRWMKAAALSRGGEVRDEE